MKPKQPIRVLIVDDSAFVRQTLREILESDPEIEVIAVASDPFVAVERIKDRLPDVITLDLEMPRMDGLTFLDRLMAQHPIPVVICSTLATPNSDVAMTALAKGAVDIIAKPKLGAKEFFEESRIRICDVVKSASHARLIASPRRAALEVPPKLTADAILAKPGAAAPIQTTDKVVVVGASTGGTEALREFLQAMPADAPGIAIVQHMPAVFTAQFALRLEQICRISVKEAENNDAVVRGQALIAPGNRHMLLRRIGDRYSVELRGGPLVRRHRPSVDVLFRSAARCGGKNVVGVIMTGMGDDGAEGMLEMKQAGAYTIAQDEATCVVFGMPAEAIKLAAARQVLPLAMIAPEVMKRAC